MEIADMFILSLKWYWPHVHVAQSTTRHRHKKYVVHLILRVDPQEHMRALLNIWPISHTKSPSKNLNKLLQQWVLCSTDALLEPFCMVGVFSNPNLGYHVTLDLRDNP